MKHLEKKEAIIAYKGSIEIWADNECSDTATEVNVAINLGNETITTSCTYI